MTNLSGPFQAANDCKESIITITYYTDPLCCWSHAMAPSIRELRSALGGLLSWRYCMGGLIPSWDNFSDPVNSVTRPLQMGPVWMHASKVSGVPIDQNLWFRDPPASSYPACIAFKCVELQSGDYATGFLELLWEKCMVAGINISDEDQLLKIAYEFNRANPSFDLKRFSNDFSNGNGRNAFSDDVQEVKASNITRFPTMIFRKQNNPSLIITGYRPFSALMKVVKKLIPDAESEETNAKC